jgi:hypothetical protein
MLSVTVFDFTNHALSRMDENRKGIILHVCAN